MKEFTEEVMVEAGKYLEGSCMNSPEFCLMTILEREATQEEEDQFLEYLEKEGIYACEVCGWFTYAGEGDGLNCDDCIKEAEEVEENES